MKRAKVNARFAITYTEQHLCHVATASLPATVDEEDETTDEEPEADEADEETEEADEADEETEEAGEADEETEEADEADEETESDDETGLSVIFDGTSQDVCMSCRCRRHGRFERGRGFGHR